MAIQDMHLFIDLLICINYSQNNYSSGMKSIFSPMGIIAINTVLATSTKALILTVIVGRLHRWNTKFHYFKSLTYRE